MSVTDSIHVWEYLRVKNLVLLKGWLDNMIQRLSWAQFLTVSHLLEYNEDSSSHKYFMTLYHIRWTVSFRQRKSVKNGKASFWHFENERLWFSHLKLLPHTNFRYFLEYLNWFETKIKPLISCQTKMFYSTQSILQAVGSGGVSFTLSLTANQTFGFPQRHFTPCYTQWVFFISRIWYFVKWF